MRAMRGLIACGLIGAMAMGAGCASDLEQAKAAARRLKPAQLAQASAQARPPVRQADQMMTPSHQLLVTGKTRGSNQRYLVWIIHPPAAIYVERQSPPPVEWFGPILPGEIP